MPISDDDVESAIKRVRGASVQESLRAHAATAANDTDKLNVIRLAHSLQGSQGWFGWFALAIGAALVFYLIWMISEAGSESPLTNVATGRPILMIIIVSTTVVYGGILLTSALNSPKADEFNDRFQRAREIFLVFSGICATVVGFYFGAGTASTAADEAADTVTVEATVASDGVITATVASGTPPYTLTLVKGETNVSFLADANDESKFTLAIRPDLCPAGGTYQVAGKDGAAYPPVQATLSEPELAAKGWTACTAAPATEEAAEGDATDAAEETPEATGAPGE